MDEPIKQELEDIWQYTSYLIGSMEKTAQNDDGSSKREIFDKELLLRGVYPINPCKLESSKTGMCTDDLKIKMKGWVESGNWDLFKEKADEIWKGKDFVDEDGLIHVPGDMDYVKMSDWLTCIYNKGDSPCGTYFECGIAMYLKIPIYLITEVIKRDVPKSLLQGVFVSGGEVFNSPKEYFDFIDDAYDLKRKEEKS